jgi:hypothetical protein
MILGLGGPRALIPHICDTPVMDLDGDTVPERFIPLSDSSGTGGCTYAVSFSRSPGVARGTIEGCWFQRGTARHHGVWDLVTVWRLGARDAATTLYRFDGKVFRPRWTRGAAERQGK